LDRGAAAEREQATALVQGEGAVGVLVDPADPVEVVGGPQVLLTVGAGEHDPAARERLVVEDLRGGGRERRRGGGGSRGDGGRRLTLRGARRRGVAWGRSLMADACRRGGRGVSAGCLRPLCGSPALRASGVWGGAGPRNGGSAPPGLR